MTLQLPVEISLKSGVWGGDARNHVGRCPSVKQHKWSVPNKI